MYKDILGVIKYIILVFAGEAILISFPFAGLVLMCFFQEHLPFVNTIIAIPFALLEGFCSLFGLTDETRFYIFTFPYIVLCLLYVMFVTYCHMKNNNNRYLGLFFNNIIYPTILLILLIVLFYNFSDNVFALVIFYTYCLIYLTVLINCIYLKFRKSFKIKKENSAQINFETTETILFQATLFVTFFYIVGLLLGMNFHMAIVGIIIGFLPFLAAHIINKKVKFQNKLSCNLLSFFLILIFMLSEIIYVHAYQNFLLR